MAWYTGRTFYACPCRFQAEHHERDGPAPETMPCPECKGVMTQWIPPGVARDRAANHPPTGTPKQETLL